MKKLSIALVFLIAILSFDIYADSYDGPEPHGTKAVISKDVEYANVRKGADTKYDVVGKLEPGTVIVYYGKIKNHKNSVWYYIGLKNDENRAIKDKLRGWVHISNISFEDK